jgi:hypothetical protein
MPDALGREKGRAVKFRGAVDPRVKSMPVPEVTREDLKDVVKGAFTGPFTWAPDLLGLMKWTESGEPLMSGDVIRESVGLDPESGFGVLGEFMDPTSSAVKGFKAISALALPGMVFHHGSPHKFAKFANEAIGTGEGAQAYGHGLYFAESPGVAKSYQRGLPHRQAQREFLAELPEDAEFDEVMELVGAGHFSPDQAEVLKALEADDWLGFDYPSQAISAAYSGKLDNWDASARLKQAVENTGHLYEVDIPDETIGKMLDWDAPLSEQPENVRRLVDDLGIKPAPKMRGESVHENVRRQLAESEGIAVFDIPKDDPRISKTLNEAGIPGIRYYDGGSRAKGEGTRNIVVFNPDDITQVKRDGELVFKK